MKTLKVVSAIIEDEAGRLLIAQRPPQKKFAGLWEFPGGKIEAGEDPQAALQRELQEELSLNVAIGRFMGIYTYTYGEDEHVELHVYVVRALNEPKRSTDVHSFKWIVPGKIDSSQLTAADVAPLRDYLEASGLSTD
jgi:8-oxo-dGTP diphosphatase